MLARLRYITVPVVVTAAAACLFLLLCFSDYRVPQAPWPQPPVQRRQLRHRGLGYSRPPPIELPIYDRFHRISIDFNISEPSSSSEREVYESPKIRLPVSIKRRGPRGLPVLPALQSIGFEDSLIVDEQQGPSTSPLPETIKLRKQNAPKYSKMQCVGNDAHFEHTAGRGCHFENICVNTRSQQWMFYQRKPAPIFLDVRERSVFSFQHKHLSFLQAEAMHSASFAPEMVTAPMPSNPNNRVFLNRTHVYFRLAFPDTNLGHFLWEELGKIFETLVMLGLNGRNALLMEGNGPKNKELFAKFAPVVTAGVSDYAMVDFSEYLKSIFQAGKIHACFRSLVVGGFTRPFLPEGEAYNSGREPLIYAFRSQILKHNGFDPYFVPSRHRITFVRKVGSHRVIQNLNEVFQSVKDHFSSSGITTEVVTLSAMDMRNQFDLLLRTTVLVSPCGGVSTMIPFLPNGAHAIVADYFANRTFALFDESPGASVHMEGSLWGHVPHVSMLYYQVEESDLYLAPGEPRGVDTRATSIRMDAYKLRGLIELALERMT